MSDPISTPSIHTKSLVLVVGAGASREVNLPVGADLKQQIADRLDIRFERFNEKISGDDQITQAFRLLTAGTDGTRGDINPLLHVSWFIRDAMPQAISIDNFIDSHRNDERIAQCGKLAIARCILDAEACSSLIVDRSNSYNKLDFGAVKNTWFNAFFQLITENCQKGELPDRLQQISIITFNYDRCIEHYLYLAFQNYYEMQADEAARLMSMLEIHHPYGKVGALPWMGGSGRIEFGATPNAQQLIDISKQLRTFTEGVDPTGGDIEAIRTGISSAQRTLFLGFAFHRLNLELLFSEHPSKHRPETHSVFATAYGLSQSDSKQIHHELVSKAGYPSDGINIRTDLTCANLFSEFRRSLTIN